MTILTVVAFVLVFCAGYVVRFLTEPEPMWYAYLRDNDEH